MSTLRLRALRRALLTASFALLAATPATLHSQRTDGRNFRIAFEPGNASRNGYMDAQVEVTYYFGVCAGRVVFLARYNPSPQMLVGNHRYWVDGRQVEVPPQIAPPQIPRPTIRGTVRGPNTVREISYLYATSAGSPSCLTNDLEIGQVSQFWPAGTADDRKLAILQSFGLDYRGTLPPLRNSAVESHFRQVFAAARTDSVRRAQATATAAAAQRRDSLARVAREQARRDSISRADAQRRASTSGAPSTGAVGGAGSGAATGAAATPTGERPMTATEQAAARDDEARETAEREAAARESAARAAALAAAQRQQQEEEFVAAVEATTVAAIGLIESIVESRRASAERKRIREARARREAEARYIAYVAAAKARFEASPPRPPCTARDVADSIVVSFAKDERTLALTGNECRLADGQSARLLTLVVNSDGPVIITPTSSPLISLIHILDAESNAAVFTKHEGPFAQHLPRGRYLMVVSSRLPGEIGDVRLSTRKGWISDAQGSLGAAAGPQQRITGFVGDNFNSTSFMDLAFALQHRRGQPYLFMNLLVATDVDASEGMFDVGLRQYIGPMSLRLQPWVEASVGYRTINVREEPFTTVSPAFGAGLNFRVNRSYGVALSATRLTGKARNTDDIWTSPPPDVPLDRTIFRLGLLIY